MSDSLRDLLDMSIEGEGGEITPDLMTADEMLKARRRMIIDHMTGTKRKGHPKLVYVTGQAGSGKSTMAERLGWSLQREGGCVRIDFDALRGYHPRYVELAKQDSLTAAEKTNSATELLIEELHDSAIENRRNVLLDDVVLGEEITRAVLQKYKAAGYEIYAVAVAEPDATCRLGVASRYEAALEKAVDLDIAADTVIPRWVSTEEQAAGVDNLKGSISVLDDPELVTMFRVSRRDGKSVYERFGKGNQAGIDPARIAADIANSQAGPELSKGWSEVLGKMKARSAPQADQDRVAKIIQKLAPPPTPVF
ncbi:MAG: hypothetical protein Alpg2KO_28560 [Alphaproteobacteria bacterium]